MLMKLVRKEKQQKQESKEQDILSLLEKGCEDILKYLYLLKNNYRSNYETKRATRPII